jgi:hypothetical protein
LLRPEQQAPELVPIFDVRWGQKPPLHLKSPGSVCYDRVAALDNDHAECKAFYQRQRLWASDLPKYEGLFARSALQEYRATRPGKAAPGRWAFDDDDTSLIFCWYLVFSVCTRCLK